MERKKSTLGFNKMPLEERDGYIGQFICATQNGNTVYGVLKKVEEGYAYFRPSIIQYSDKTIYAENEKFSRLLLPLVSIKPIKGSIEEYVQTYNNNLKNDKTN